MITETGRIVAIEDDCLWVETVQKSTCQSCAAEKGCGQSLVSKWGGQTSFIRVLLEGREPEDYRLHDLVSVGIPEEVVAKGSLFVYLTPLLGLVVAALAGNAWALSEGAVMLLSLCGFGGGALAVRYHSFYFRNDRRVQPVLLDDTTPVLWSNDTPQSAS